jgi:hypothetical protein
MRVSLGSLLVIGAVLVTAMVAILAASWMARRRRDMQLREHGSPLLVVPTMGAAPVAFPASMPAHPSPMIERRFSAAEIPNAEVVVPFSGPISAVEDPITATTGRFAPGSVPAEVVLGHSLRFHRPPDGTLQFLPGALQVVGGPDAGHEVRFVRPSDGESTDITFGRKEGPPYRHIQLLEPTVSRTHARLSLENSRWRATNLSRTNPVLINGRPLEGVNASHLLAHDDLIEMGALVFRYHDR